MNKSILLASLLALTSGAFATIDRIPACEKLEALHPKKTYYPLELQYTLTNTNFFDLYSHKDPACIFLPEKAQDVSDAIEILTEENTQFALKSGGHMPGGFNNIDDGVLISTERLNTLEWAEHDKILRVGPGNRWGDVYDFAAEKEKVVVGGRLQVVGVAGLVIGGGISYLSGEHGFSCDNVKGFEVVLGNGTITYASEQKNPDLFRALRGGTSNFGVVTRFDMDAYPLPRGWSDIGTMILTEKNKPDFLNALADYVTNGTVIDEKSGAIITVTRAAGVDLGLLSLWRSEPEVDPKKNTPEVFKSLLDLPAVHTVKNRPLNKVAKEFGGIGPGAEIKVPVVSTFRTGSYFASRELIFEIEKIHKEEFEKIKLVPGLITTITFQPITPNNIHVGATKRGGNVMGLERRIARDSSVPFFWTEQYASWFYKKDSEKVEAVQRIIWDRSKEAAERLGVFDDFIYLNDAAPDQAPDVFPAYGADNHQFLKNVQKKYDPNGVFTNLVPGGFKL